MLKFVDIALFSQMWTVQNYSPVKLFFFVENKVRKKLINVEIRQLFAISLGFLEIVRNMSYFCFALCLYRCTYICVCVVHLVHGEFSSGVFRKAFMLVDTDNMNLVSHDTLRSENSEGVIGSHIASKCGSVLCHLLTSVQVNLQDLWSAVNPSCIHLIAYLNLWA